jgi:hypothetical protein
MIKFVITTPRKMKYSTRLIIASLVTLLLTANHASAQRPGTAARFYEMAQEIDSLQSTVAELNRKLYHSDSLYKAEKFTSAELKDQMLKMEQEQQSLVASKTDVEDENLKLNQSNRILIIFNSVVAVLLVVTLIFVLKRAGRKSPAAFSSLPTKPVSTSINQSNKLASFEDKLAQLEKLGGLKEKGILSDEEFQDEKQRILGR